MKKSFKFRSVAFAAIMALGSLASVSCDKENDLLDMQTPGTTSFKTDSPSNPGVSAIFLIDEMFHDSMGRCWHMKGSGSWINVGGGRNGVHLNVKFKQCGQDYSYLFKGQAIWNLTSDPTQFNLIPDEGAPEPSRLVWFVMREYSHYLLYHSGQGSAKNVSDADDGIHFPIELQQFTDSNNTTWTVWGGYYELLGRRAIRFDIKFYPTYSSSRVAIRHFVGTVTFDLNGGYVVTGGDFRMTDEIREFLRDFARYYLNH